MNRANARMMILSAANRGQWYGTRYTMRNLDRAVFRCRQRGLVRESVLVDAGFNPRKKVNR